MEELSEDLAHCDVTLSVATFIWDVILLLVWTFSEVILRHILDNYVS